MLSWWRSGGISSCPLFFISRQQPKTRPRLARPQLETLQQRLYYSLPRCSRSHCTSPAAVRSGADAASSVAGRLCWTTVQHIDPNRHGLTTRPSKQPWGDMALSTRNSITRSEVKPRRVGWFVICHPLPGSCWSQKQATTLKPCEQGPQRHCVHVPCTSEPVMSLLSQRTVVPANGRRALSLPRICPLRCCQMPKMKLSRYLSHRREEGAACTIRPPSHENFPSATLNTARSPVPLTV